jgi:5-deoxy-glucuronate isomerase
MPELVRCHDNANRAIVAAHPAMDRTYFNRVRLPEGGNFEDCLRGHESAWVVLSGTVNVLVDGQPFASVGRRRDIWSGQADSVYAPIGAHVRIENTAGPAEILVAGALCSQRHAPFRITPDELEMVEVGSHDTHSRRRIFHIIGQNGRGRTGSLLVSELYADAGCWSGYPPHKHDTDRADGETAHEELYHYRFMPETGFGVQVTYEDGRERCFMTRNGDSVLVDRGYHPTVTSPGHRSYIFTILVGKTQHGLVQYFDPTHAHLTADIPGIQAMRDKFR